MSSTKISERQTTTEVLLLIDNGISPTSALAEVSGKLQNTCVVFYFEIQNESDATV